MNRNSPELLLPGLTGSLKNSDWSYLNVIDSRVRLTAFYKFFTRWMLYLVFQSSKRLKLPEILIYLFGVQSAHFLHPTRLFLELVSESCVRLLCV